jgi:NAD(P)-dependent dehydrogenase (short-subunit alcohol dehydrogenase family)
VTALSESLRAEVAPFGVHVIEVYPGPVETDMLAASKRIPEAHRSPAYAPLAEHIGALRGHEPITPVAEAATAIVDAIVADPPPHRMSCDRMGRGLLAGWASTPVADWHATFLSAFALPR